MITKFHILFSDEVFNVKSNWDKTHLFSLVNDFEDLEWNYTRFINFIFNNLMYTALSEEEREKMINQDSTRLQQACRKLRFTDSKDKGEGSEIAEIFLYGIMNEYYHALPVVPKIFYKQNSQDPVKGADSVHIVINDNDFSLWLGEAKFYKSIEDSRLDRIVESVIDSLNTNKIKKENSIITNLQDIKKLIKDEVLLKQILLALEHDSSIDYIKTKIHFCTAAVCHGGITGKRLNGFKMIFESSFRSWTVMQGAIRISQQSKTMLRKSSLLSMRNGAVRYC